MVNKPSVVMVNKPSVFEPLKFYCTIIFGKEAGAFARAGAFIRLKKYQYMAIFCRPPLVLFLWEYISMHDKKINVWITMQ